jgi:hypothetical protein
MHFRPELQITPAQGQGKSDVQRRLDGDSVSLKSDEPSMPIWA